LLLCYIKDNYIKINVTKLVSKLSKELNCSESTIWNNLNPLKKISLVNYGSLQNKGIPVQLTKIGEIISKKLNDEHEVKC